MWDTKHLIAETIESRHRLRPGPALALPVAALGFFLLVWFLASVDGRPLGEFTRDPNQMTGQGAAFGIVSVVGLFLWAAGIGVAWFAAALTSGDARRALVGWGALSAWLLVDDAFILHEIVLPETLGIPEKVVYLAYGLAALAGYVVVRPLLLKAGTDLVVLASGALLAVSILADSFEVDWVGEDVFLAVEDGAKLLGIALWTTASVLSAASTLQEATAGSPHRTRAGARPGPQVVARPQVGDERSALPWDRRRRA